MRWVHKLLIHFIYRLHAHFTSRHIKLIIFNLKIWERLLIWTQKWLTYSRFCWEIRFRRLVVIQRKENGHIIAICEPFVWFISFGCNATETHLDTLFVVLFYANVQKRAHTHALGGRPLRSHSCISLCALTWCECCDTMKMKMCNDRMRLDFYVLCVKPSMHAYCIITRIMHAFGSSEGEWR